MVATVPALTSSANCDMAMVSVVLVLLSFRYAYPVVSKRSSATLVSRLTQNESLRGNIPRVGRCGVRWRGRLPPPGVLPG